MRLLPETKVSEHVYSSMDVLHFLQTRRGVKINEGNPVLTAHSYELQDLEIVGR